jgi:flagellar hook-length control protein FliK
MNDGKPAQPTVVDAPAAGDVVTDFIARVREVASAGRSADARRIDIAAMFAAMKAPGSADVAQAGGVAAGTAPAANPAASVDIAARSLGAEAFFRALAGNRAAAASGADDGNPGLAAGAGRTSAGGETLPVSTSGPLPAAVDDGDPAAETGDRAAARLLTALDAEKTTLDAERTTLRFGDGDGLGPPPQAAAPPTPGPAAGLPGGATAAAAADPAALVADTVSSDDILRQVTVRLSRLQPGDGQVRLQLQPAELGRVDVQLTMESHEMTARFIVQHPEVRELLHRHLDQLRDSLAVNGVEVKQVAVEVAPAHRGEGANLNAAHQDGRDAFGSPGHSGGRQDDGGTRGDHPRTVVADAENIAGRATAGGAADDHPEGHTATRRRSLDLRV